MAARIAGLTRKLQAIFPVLKNPMLQPQLYENRFARRFFLRILERETRTEMVVLLDSSCNASMLPGSP